MGQKIRLSEAQLKKIILESTKKVLSEIGDTPEGRNVISNVLNKWGDSPIRRKQIDNVRQGLKDIYQNEFDPEEEMYVSDTIIRYPNSFGDPVRISAQGMVKLPGAGYEQLMVILNDRELAAQIGTRDRNMAKRIARWCSEKLPQNSEEFRIATDWHTWIA